MKQKVLLDALTDVNPLYIEEAAPKKKKRYWLRVLGSAACILLAVTVLFGMAVRSDFHIFLKTHNFFSYHDFTLEMTFLPVGNRTARYYNPHGKIDTEILERFKGELYMTENHVPHELYGTEAIIDREWYYIKDSTNLQYLICSENGELSLWEFSCFITNALHLWLEPEDTNVTPYTYGEVFSEIYGLSDANQIEKIKILPETAHNTDEGRAVQREIGKKTVTDKEKIKILYEIIKKTHFYSDESYPKRETPLSYDFDTSLGRDGRYLAIILSDGTEIDCLKYTATGGFFYEYSGIHSEPIAEEDVFLINEISGIG